MVSAFDPTTRRPIATRDTRWAHTLAGFLAYRGVAPNAVSLAGMTAGVLAGAALVGTGFSDDWPRRGCWLAAAVLVQLRLLANLLDGMVAEKAGRATRVGVLFNEAPDRVSDAAVLIGLGYATGGVPELGYLATIGAMLTAYVRALGMSAGGPPVFVGPMGKPQRMAVVTACAVACAVLPNELGEAIRLAAIAAGVCFAGALVTAGRGLAATATYLRGLPP